MIVIVALVDSLNKATRMKLSRYNLHVSNDSTVLVYNTRTGNYALIPKDIFNDFNAMGFDADTLSKFESLGFYVSKDLDEFSSIQEECNRRTRGNKIRKLRILTTTGCNAKCPYCYEKGVKHSFLTNEVAKGIVSFLTSEIESGDKIRIEWFGGEPLLNVNAIDYISNQVKENLPNDCDFASNIVTNGFLITPHIIEKMKNVWNLKQVQITLDGIGKDYEKVKMLGKDSFEKVIDNIRLLIENQINVDIRVNFDSHNLKQVEDLLSYLSALPYGHKLNVYPAKIFSDETKKGYFDLEEESILVNELFRKYGFRKGEKLLPRSFHTSCMASYPNFYTISPTGKIFKCDRQFLDIDAIADVKDSPVSSQLTEYVKSNDNIAEKCQKCVLYPLCWGGCYYDRENGLYPCYLSSKIVLSSMKMALEDMTKKDTED